MNGRIGNVVQKTRRLQQLLSKAGHAKSWKESSTAHTKSFEGHVGTHLRVEESVSPSGCQIPINSIYSSLLTLLVNIDAQKTFAKLVGIVGKPNVMKPGGPEIQCTSDQGREVSEFQFTVASKSWKGKKMRCVFCPRFFRP